MRVLVCGGRHYGDVTAVFTTLDTIHRQTPIACIVNGGADGADALARVWARQVGVSEETYHADWELYGKRAGPLRNLRMLVEGKPDMVVAFPGGFGTADMVRQAHRAGVPVCDQYSIATSAPNVA